MLNEVKFSTYVDTNTYVEDIDLNDFIKCETTEPPLKIDRSFSFNSVYINHRPAFGLNPADLHRAFDVLCDQISSLDGQPQMTRENLLNLLQQCGEHMSDYEMADCLSNLLHLNNQSTDLFKTMNAEDACNTTTSCIFSPRRRLSLFRSIRRESITGTSGIADFYGRFDKDAFAVRRSSDVFSSIATGTRTKTRDVRRFERETRRTFHGTSSTRPFDAHHLHHT